MNSNYLLGFLSVKGKHMHVVLYVPETHKCSININRCITFIGNTKFFS